MFRYVKLDETKHWNESIVKRAGKIEGVYIYDDEVATHLCELAPSYELHFIESQYSECPDSQDDRERLYDDILEGNMDTESVTYMHVSAIRKMETFPLEGFDTIEDTIEYAQGNSL